MKAKILFLSIVLLGFLYTKPVSAKNENRDVSSFTEIGLSISGKLYLKQGNKQNLKVVGQSSTLEKLITEVKGDKLIIRYPNRNHLWNSFYPGKIEIYVTVPEIKGIAVSGSGDIIAEDEIVTNKMNLAISGSGSINFKELDAKHVNAAVSGSGDIIINGGGVAERFDTSISGSGGVKASGFEAKKVNVKIAGSGNCSITSYGELNTRIAGSGNVYYKGNPDVNSSIAGSGKVKKM